MTTVTRRSFLGASIAIAAAARQYPASGDTAQAPLRIGVVGSDNSHAQRFAELFNLPPKPGKPHVDGARITHIWGEDPARTREVAEAGQIANIVDAPAAMLGAVDGVFCVHRHGARHLEDARTFLEAGLPVFVDKPLACSIADAEALLDLAAKSGAAFSSFSTLPYARTTIEYIQSLRANAGTIVSGLVYGPCDITSEYCGVFYYGIHCVELMNAVFGFGCRSVAAVEHHGDVLVNCRFESGPLVALHLSARGKHDFVIDAFGTDGTLGHKVDSATAYEEGLKRIVHMFRTGDWPLDRAQLLEPVRILTAIQTSLKESREIPV